jgi:hypothetical protein
MRLWINNPRACMPALTDAPGLVGGSPGR